MAYKGLVRPVLEYGSSVWDPKAYFFKMNFRNDITTIASLSSVVNGYDLRSVKPISRASTNFQILEVDFQGVNFGSLERKTWKSGTSKGDRWTIVQCTCVRKLLL